MVLLIITLLLCASTGIFGGVTILWSIFDKDLRQFNPFAFLFLLCSLAFYCIALDVKVKEETSLTSNFKVVKYPDHYVLITPWETREFLHLSDCRKLDTSNQIYLTTHTSWGNKLRYSINVEDPDASR